MITALWQWVRQYRLDPQWWTLPRVGGLALIFGGTAAIAWQMTGRSTVHATTGTEVVVVSRLPMRTLEQPGSAAATTDGRTETEKRPVAGVALSRALQASLRQADCYDGPVNGTWTRQSREAMARFVARVNATLPVDQPDQVLLLLLESNPTARCQAEPQPTRALSPFSPPMPLAAPPRVEPGSIATSAQGSATLPPLLAPVPQLASRSDAVGLALAPPGKSAASEEELWRQPAARARGTRLASKQFRRHIHRYKVRRAYNSGVSRTVARNLRSLKRALSSVF